VGVGVGVGVGEGGGGMGLGVAVGAARIARASGGTVGSPGPGGVTVGRWLQSGVAGGMAAVGVGDGDAETGDGGAVGRRSRKAVSRRARATIAIRA